MWEFLFGWITKPKMMYTVADELVSAMELMILVILIFTIIGLALHIWSKVEERGKNVKNEKSNRF